MMRNAATLVAIGGFWLLAGGCTPAATETGEPGACAGKCDGTGDEAQGDLLFGERREVGAGDDASLSSGWSYQTAFSMRAGSRARITIQPEGDRVAPWMTVQRDRGSSVEWVAQTEPGVTELVVDAADVEADEASYVLEIHGDPAMARSAAVELRCEKGDCGAPVDVRLVEQRLRDLPAEVSEALGDESWNVWRVSADRADFVDSAPTRELASRMALDADRARELVGAEVVSLESAGELALSRATDYRGGDAALDALKSFLDPDGARYHARLAEARIAHAFVDADGARVEVEQTIRMALLRSRTGGGDLVISLDRRTTR